MKTSPSDWVQWEKDEVLPFEGGISFHVRTNTACLVTNEFGLILGYGIGEQLIAVTGKGEISFDCKTPIWVRPSTRVQERLQSSPEIFTSLDRPSPLSPEMQAIHRMMRRNEIDREHDRREMEKRFADRSREFDRPKPETDAQEAPATEKKKVGVVAGASRSNTEDKKPPSSADAKASRVSGSEPTADESGSTDSS